MARAVPTLTPPDSARTPAPSDQVQTVPTASTPSNSGTGPPSEPDPSPNYSAAPSPFKGEGTEELGEPGPHFFHCAIKKVLTAQACDKSLWYLRYFIGRPAATPKRNDGEAVRGFGGGQPPRSVLVQSTAQSFGSPEHMLTANA
jgi:hypothetical protein